MQVCPLKKCVTETLTLRGKYYLKPANTHAPSDFISEKPEAEEPQWLEQLRGSQNWLTWGFVDDFEEISRKDVFVSFRPT